MRKVWIEDCKRGERLGRMIKTVNQHKLPAGASCITGASKSRKRGFVGIYFKFK